MRCPETIDESAAPAIEYEESGETEDGSSDDEDVDRSDFEFIQATADIVIRAMQAGRSADVALARLTAWLEEYRSEPDFSPGADEAIMAVTIECVARRLHDTDADVIADSFGLDEDEPISVEDRLRYAEETLLPLLLDDADVAYCLSPVAIAASDGTPAVMVMYIQGYSFSGVTTTWLGPFPSWTEYVASLKRDGWVTCVEDFTQLPTAEKLQRLQAWK